jgi:hypothetical protein
MKDQHDTVRSRRNKPGVVGRKVIEYRDASTGCRSGCTSEFGVGTVGEEY